MRKMGPGRVREWQEPRTSRVLLKIEPSLHDELRRLAKLRGTSVSYIIRSAAWDAVADREEPLDTEAWRRGLAA